MPKRAKKVRGCTEKAADCVIGIRDTAELSTLAREKGEKRDFSFFLATELEVAQKRGTFLLALATNQAAPTTSTGNGTSHRDQHCAGYCAYGHPQKERADLAGTRNRD